MLLKRIQNPNLQYGTSNMYLYIKKTRFGRKIYRYLILEEYISPLENNGERKRIQLLKLPVDKAIKLILWALREVRGIRWCGGWDLNPRRPTPSGPEPDPFDLARAPPHSLQFLWRRGRDSNPRAPLGAVGLPYAAGNRSRAHRLKPLGHPGSF